MALPIKVDNPELTLEILQQLPKVDLHRHLDGSVRAETVLDLALEQGVALPTEDLEELREYICVKDDCPSLEVYLRGFTITCSVLQKQYALTRVMYEVCEDAVADGLRYVEIRFSPVLHVNENMGLSQVMEAVCEGLVMAEYHLPIRARIIVCGMRHLGAASTLSIAQVAWRYRSRGVVAFDLAGPENGFSSVEHKDAFELIRKNLLKVTIHSGEAAGPESIRDSIRQCGAQRIGHGVTLTEAKELLSFVVDRQIPLECCPTSNLQTKAVQSLQSHPLREFYDAGVMVTVNTDNPVVSNVTLSEELLRVHKEMGFSVYEIVHLIDNGFRSTFAHSGERERMRAEALYQTVAILEGHGFDVGPIKNDVMYVNASVPFDYKIGSRFWGGVPPKTPSVDAIRALPKADLHARLDGSQCMELLWAELQSHAEANGEAQVVTETGHTLESIDDLRALIQQSPHTKRSTAIAKRILNSMLQTREQILRAMDSMYRIAHEENVVYMEVVFSPASHLRRDFETYEEVLECVIEGKRAAEDAYGIQSSLLLSCSTTPEHMHDPIVFFDTAKLTVKYAEHVCGFGVFGHADLPAEAYPYYQTTFEYLKEHSVKVSIGAGNKQLESLVCALMDGGASRISGGFQVHRHPHIMAHLTDNKIPLEIAYTDKLKAMTKDVLQFSSSPIELFVDNGIATVVCSFRRALYSHSYSESIATIAQISKLDVSQIFKLMSMSFECSFQHHHQRLELLQHYWRSAEKVAQEYGFKYIRKIHFIDVPNSARPAYFNAVTPGDA